MIGALALRDSTHRAQRRMELHALDEQFLVLSQWTPGENKKYVKLFNTALRSMSACRLLTRQGMVGH